MIFFYNNLNIPIFIITCDFKRNAIQREHD